MDLQSFLPPFLVPRWQNGGQDLHLLSMRVERKESEEEGGLGFV